MPIYEYKCEACEKCFEKLTFKGDDEKIVCPECKGESVKRQMSCTSLFNTKSIGSCAAGAPKGFS